VFLHLLHGNLPSLHRVAVRAVGAHLSLVDVGVAVLAILPHVGEDRLHMALRALHFFVHASQGIFCFVVIELGNRLDGPPGCRGVAVLARDRKRTVRTARRSALRLRETRAACWPGKQQHPESEF